MSLLNHVPLRPLSFTIYRSQEVRQQFEVRAWTTGLIETLHNCFAVHNTWYRVVTMWNYKMSVLTINIFWVLAQTMGRHLYILSTGQTMGSYQVKGSSTYRFWVLARQGLDRWMGDWVAHGGNSNTPPVKIWQRSKTCNWWEGLFRFKNLYTYRNGIFGTRIYNGPYYSIQLF